MANFLIPTPPVGKRPTDTYQWLGMILDVLKNTKGIDWYLNNTMSIKQLGESIGNDTNFNTTVTNRINTAISTEFTPPNILTKLKTVDGSGSGLDADLVRGYVPVNKAGDLMSGFLTLHSDPTQPMHAATKLYVDSVLEGFTIKVPVKVATTQNETLSGIREIDGITTTEGDRILVKNQTDKTQNGIYTISSSTWTRSSDANSDNDLKPGTYVFVNEGLINKDSSWVLVNDSVVLGTTLIDFTQFSGTGQITAGTGLFKNGNTLGITNTGVIAGTYTKVTVDLQGRITSGTILSASDIPVLDWSKITTGKPTTIQGYGITNGVRTDQNGTITGTLTLNSNLFTIQNGTTSLARLVADTTTPNMTYLQSGTDTNKSGQLKITGKDVTQLSLFEVSVIDSNNAKINGSKIITTADFGSGKGIDADLLDGIDSLNYARTDITETFEGGVIINGSTDSGAINMGGYRSAGTNLILNGDSLGRSGIFFKSEKDGTNIAHGSDYGFIQYHPYGLDSTSGEANRLVIGVANDSTDNLVLQVPYKNNLKVSFLDASTGSTMPEYTIWHEGNDGSGTGLDADLLDGQHGSYYQDASNLNAGTVAVARMHNSVLIGDNATWSNNEDTTFKKERSGFKRHNGTSGITGGVAIHVANPLVSNGEHSAGISLAHGSAIGSARKMYYYGFDASATKAFEYEIWHAGRMGSGSTLDADLLDGKHYSDLVNQFVDVAGDTMTGYLTLNADPTNPLHAATKQYVDATVQGLDFKQSVRVATTTNLTNLSGLLTIDGIVLVANDRVLVKDQTDSRLNGIYVANASTWTRAIDANTLNKLNIGAYIFVEQGTINGASGWVIDSIGTGDIGVATISFVRFSGTGQIVAGTGLGKNGNELYITNTGITPGTYTKLTIDAQGRATIGTTLVASDIPNLDWSKITTGKPTTIAGYGITNAVTKTGDTMTGELVLDGGGSSTLSLLPGSSDHTYMEFYARTANKTARSGYFGYTSAGTTQLELINSIGNILISPTSGNTTINSDLYANGDVIVRGNSAELILETLIAAGASNQPKITFKTPESQNIEIVQEIIDGSLPRAGYALKIRKTSDNSQQGNYADLVVEGNVYVNNDKLVWSTANLNPSDYVHKTNDNIITSLNTINRAGEAFILKGTASGNSNTTYIAFKDASNVRQAYVGMASTGNSTFYIRSEISNADIELNTTGTGILYHNGSKVWTQGNDGSGSGLDADLLDGANSDVNATNDTIVKRDSSGAVNSTTTKTNTIELGGKVQIAYNATENSIDFILI